MKIHIVTDLKVIVVLIVVLLAMRDFLLIACGPSPRPPLFLWHLAMMALGRVIREHLHVSFLHLFFRIEVMIVVIVMIVINCRAGIDTLSALDRPIPFEFKGLRKFRVKIKVKQTAFFYFLYTYCYPEAIDCKA